MTESTSETIVAVAVPRGGAVRGVIRLSGSSVFQIVDRCFVAERSDEWQDVRYGVVRGRFEVLGCAVPVKLWIMRRPRTYTREDTIEIHLPGNVLLIESVIETLVRNGARPALPGEFTRRAFLNGRIDLTQTEAVAALIHARNEADRRAAVAMLDGAVSRRVREISDAILSILTPLELSIDFSDQDIDIVDADDLGGRLDDVGARLGALAQASADEASSRAGKRVVLVGAANAGKSSLFNALLGEERAIVSEVRGTTRDPIEAEIEYRGRRWTLIDTAGEDHVGSELDQAAHRFRETVRLGADLEIRVRDGRRPLEIVPDESGLDVATFADLVAEKERRTGPIWVSSVDRTGVDALLELIARQLDADEDSGGDFSSCSRRHSDVWRRAKSAVDEAATAFRGGAGVEIVASLLHASLTDLAELTGADYSDELLERIMRDFCIGK